MNHIVKIWILAVCFLTPLEVTLSESTFDMGVVADFRSLKLKSDVIPSKVKQEAVDPSIVNPYSGNYFGKNVIGAYDPGETFSFLDAGFFLQYIFDLGPPVKPYLRAELQYPFSASTHKGEFGEGYTYEKILGGGSDYVRYTYGIKYDYKYYIEPEIGFTYNRDDTFTISFGVGYQRLELEYYKGIEAFGETKNLSRLGTSTHDLFNYKLRFRKEISQPFSFSVEPSYCHGNGLEGYSIAVYVVKRY